MALAEELIRKGVLKNERLINAFRKADREKFVPKEDKKFAYADEPLPIGEGQTISQPWTVAFMLELLDPKPGENIMEIGYGSGWVTSLMASCGANVYAIERVESLCEWGKKNLEGFLGEEKVLSEISLAPNRKEKDFKSGLARPHLEISSKTFSSPSRVHLFCQDGTKGLPEVAKNIGEFDKIIAAAAAQRGVPDAWKEQLKIGGRIVAPAGSAILVITKTSAKAFDTKEYPGFAFVPLISD